LKVMIALENRFYEGPSGKVYSNNIFDYRVWQRYLQVFDEVVIFARVGKTEAEPNQPAASGPGVRFYRLPMFVGPRQYVRQHGTLRKLAAKALTDTDACILRIPGTMGTLLWRVLRKAKRPYGVEVVGDAAESIDTCGAGPLVKLVLKTLFSRNQRRQCHQAAAAAYVSEKYLQSLYPCDGWTTYYSSIDLRPGDLLTDEQWARKIAHLHEPYARKRPFVICHAGTMAARYKGQEILIEAVAGCLGQGFDIQLVLMGDGQFRTLYEQKAATLGIADRVQFLGNVPAGQAVRDQYDRSDLLVFPSLTEGLPRTIIEAMARGLPCIGSRVGGIPELLEDEFLFEPGDVGVLAQKIGNLLAGKIDVAATSKRNLKKAKEFRFEILNERRRDFYRKVSAATQEASS